MATQAYNADPDCPYCTDPNIILAGRTPDHLICERHIVAHRQKAAAFARILPRTEQPRFRYFAHRGWWYCWTTERMSDGKFAAFIYKPEGDAMILAKEVHFAKRMTAKAKALAWQTKAKESASGRPPASVLR